jgi:anti-sigma B factor antagonist
MEVTTTEYTMCNLVKAKGRIDSATATQLAEAFEALTKAGKHKIALDMGEVDYISSAGLRALINAQKNSKRVQDGSVVLACVPKRIYEVIDLAGFVPLFKFFNDVATAIESF